MLSWLVVDGELPESVRSHLLAALTAWEPLMGDELFPVEPLAGPECDVAGLLEGQWWRRAEQAESARWHDRVALVEGVRAAGTGDCRCAWSSGGTGAARRALTCAARQRPRGACPWLGWAAVARVGAGARPGMT